MINISPYMHIPFKDKGRDYDGADCYGLYYLISRDERDLLLPSYVERYQTSHDKEQIAAIIDHERSTAWAAIAREAIVPGDLVVLRIIGRPWHCGMMLDDNRFLHTEEELNVCQGQLSNVRWNKRIVGFYRWKGNS